MKVKHTSVTPSLVVKLLLPTAESIC